MRISCFLYFFLLASPLAAEAPLSAIDWLSIKKNDVESNLKSVEKESSDTNKDIQVSTLSSDKFQSIGLLPVYVTGIPTTIWRNSSFNDLTYSFKTMPTFSYPPIQELVYSLLLAEARPPLDEPESYSFLNVRLQKLLSYGAVDPAIALIERASPVPDSMVPLLFDISLLSSNNMPACDPIFRKRKNKELQGELVYCYARKGDRFTTSNSVLYSTNKFYLSSKSAGDFSMELKMP